MSESDDLEILADIQALDEALALKKEPQQSDQIALSDVEESEDNDDYLNYLYTNRHIDKSLNAYEINTRLITGLTMTKKKLTVLLEECEQKIKVLDEKMMKSKDEFSLTSKLTISNAGMPYFKDKNYFGSPKNYDSKLKEARGELFLPSLRKPNRWTRKDREMLITAINNQAIESVLCGEFNKTVDNNSTSDNQNEKTKLVLPRNFNEMVGAIGEREFDWHKISVMDFDNKHSPGECRAMWNVYLHPDFRKNEWTNAEDKKLLKYVKEYKCQDWDAITQRLGTNRSAYQCFIRYNTIKKVPSAGRPWTKQEDNHLMKVIDAIRIGDYIPWTEMANHMRHRTKQQIYVRWMYRKAPHLKKGRFTNTETSTLLKAVQKYGTDFCRISSVVMPNRTSIQLQQRYHTVMTKDENIWTLKDDTTLIKLHMKYKYTNNNWSKIATHFSNKSRVQIRHRYSALLKYINRGMKIEDIPRRSTSYTTFSFRHNRHNLLKKSFSNRKTRNKITLNEQQTQTKCAVHISDIQLRLYETLCFPPSIKFNNFEEFYDIIQLAHETKKLYNTLHSLDANLDIPGDFLNYVQLNSKDKQLLISLREHMNALKNNGNQNDELIKTFRTRMFGYDSEVSESDFFIPPLPFDGHVRKTKMLKNQHNTSIDYNLGLNEKFLVDIEMEKFSETSYISPFLNIDEEIQFYKFGQLLTSNYYNYNVDLYKSLKCIFYFDKTSTSDKASPGYNELNKDSKINFEDKETISIDEETNTNDIILPDQTTLLGWKNLLLWKLLYDCQDVRKQCEPIAPYNPTLEQTTTNSWPVQTESAEYQLLRTRLIKLFKFPISLSNTMLQKHGPETTFSTQETDVSTISLVTTQPTDVVISTISRKRKFQDKKSVRLNKTGRTNRQNKSNVSASASQHDLDATTQNLPTVRSCKKISKKYTIVMK